MKKLIILSTLIIIVLSCTAEDRELWNEVQREKKERGGGCYRDPYYGNIKCGYRR